MQTRLFKPSMAVALLTALMGLQTASLAQGILLPRPSIHIQPFYVKNLHVDTVITDAVAETTVEQTFVNDSSVEQEGTYLYPLPEGAMPTAFSMTVGDKTMEPRILPQSEARGIYESIVRSRKDPALLEYIGRNLVRVSIFPIPAHGERVIRMRYSEVLKPSSGLYRYAYPISTSRFGSRPIGLSTVTIRLRATEPIKNIYSPSHDVSIRRPDDRSANISWEGINDASDRDLSLYYSLNGGDVGLSLLTYRSGERDGYFMLLASPRVTVPKDRILPKQIVFVLDRTGSMAGPKIKQARRSLLYCLDNLNPKDRFDVITFNESPDVLTRTLQPATEENIAKAHRFVEDIQASGGTNIDEALRAALTLLKNEDGSEKMVVFLTDGLPTVGETNINTILQHVKDLNEGHHLAANEERQVRPAALKHGGGGLVDERPGVGAKARLFCFGLGYDVNVPFLDRLADQGHGDADYIKPEEDVEVKVSAFYAKVTSPVLSEVKLAFERADVYDVYPKTMPDLFKGSQIVVTGRFRGEGGGTVRLSGLSNGTAESFKTTTGFSEAGGANAFVPRIWAARKIGWLADQLRLSENPAGRQEVIDEIVRLSRDYGIITEYTSFLVDEREQRQLGLRDMDGHFDLGKNSEIFRREVARRAGANGIQGLNATDQSLRSKDLQASDKTASRYQTNRGGVYRLYSYGEENKAIAAAPGNYAALPAGGGLGGGRRGPLEPAGPEGADAKQKKLAADALVSNTNITVQAVDDRTFYLQGNNVWQDQSYDPKKQQNLVKIKVFSDAHFALLKAVPRLAAYSSVGDEVIVRLGNNAIQIGNTGKEKLTDAELKTLATR